jgi:hypothetical protein
MRIEGLKMMVIIIIIIIIIIISRDGVNQNRHTGNIVEHTELSPFSKV